MDVVGEAGYRRILQSLLPRGAAWPTEPAAHMTRLLDAVAASLARLDGSALGLLTDALPADALRMLADWERIAALPDECATDISRDIEVRRGILVARMLLHRHQTPATYIAIARAMGYTATIIEHDEIRARGISDLDTSGGRWRYVWWIQVSTGGLYRYWDTLSTCETPLCRYDGPADAELACRLQTATPAHTYLVVQWVP